MGRGLLRLLRRRAGAREELVGVNFWTALFVLLNTLAIFFVAKKYLTEPVMKIIAQRHSRPPS